MKHLFSLLVLFALLFFSSCSNSQPGPKSSAPISKGELDYSKIELKVERGAFHYDTFIVNISAVKFIPEEERSGQKGDEVYFRRSETTIKKEEFIELIDYVLDNGFWDCKDFYDEQSSCTSGLKIQLKIGNQMKKVTCEDFERGCPDFLYKIEQKVVKLHGKGLSRKFLPG